MLKKYVIQRGKENSITIEIVGIGQTLNKFQFNLEA
jgi:hypothetical protein